MNRVLWSTCTVLALLAAGCDSGPATGTVEGTVTLDGEPQANVMVTFSPVEGGMSSTGTTDENGKYSLTYPGGKGAVVGKHKVSVKTLPPPVETQGSVSSDDPSYQGGMTQSPSTTETVEPIPAKYNVETQLIKEVKSGRNTIDLELTTE